MSNSEILQIVFVAWGACYVYAFAVGMFRFANRQKKTPFFARMAVCIASALLGPIFIVLDLADLVRSNLRKVAAGFIITLSFMGNVLMDMIIKLFILLFGLVFIFLPARKR